MFNLITVILLTASLLTIILMFVGSQRMQQSRLLNKYNTLNSVTKIDGLDVVYVKAWNSVPGFQRLNGILYISDEFKGDSSFITGAYHGTKGRIYNFHNFVKVLIYIAIASLIPVGIFAGGIAAVGSIVAVAMAFAVAARNLYVQYYQEVMEECYPVRRKEELEPWFERQGFWLVK